MADLERRMTGRKFRQIRNRLGITQQTIANELGYSVSWIRFQEKAEFISPPLQKKAVPYFQRIKAEIKARKDNK